ncbi:MAG: aquaporin [bacterium]
MSKYITEFVGTFLFLLVISLVAPSGHPLTPLAIGGALMIMVFMGGHVSGGHYNPAVTIGLASVKKCPASDVLPYIVCQVLGGAAAFALGGFLLTGAKYHLGPFGPGEGFGMLPALIVEFLFTMALVLTVLNVACTKRTSGNSYYGIAIGFVIVCAAAAAGGISGGAFNPAVGIGATLGGSMYGGGGWSNVWIYLVGPILGGLIGAQIWKLQNPEESAA